MHPDIDLAGNGEQINDICDMSIMAPDIEHSGQLEVLASNILDLHPECKCVIIVQESGE